MRDGIGANQGQRRARSRDELYPVGGDTGSRRHAYGITGTTIAEHCDSASRVTLDERAYLHRVCSAKLPGRLAIIRACTGQAQEGERGMAFQSESPGQATPAGLGME